MLIASPLHPQATSHRDKPFIEADLAAGSSHTQGGGDLVIPEASTRLSGGAGLHPASRLPPTQAFCSQGSGPGQEATIAQVPQPPSPSGTRWAQGRTGGTEPALGSRQAGKGAEKPAAGGAPRRRVADMLPVSTGHPAGASSGGALFLLVPQSEAHTLAHIHTHAHTH